MATVRESYADFVPAFAVEMMEEHDGRKVPRETLRTGLIQDGVWPSRKQRRTFHQRRLLRVHRMLVQPLSPLNYERTASEGLESPSP